MWFFWFLLIITILLLIFLYILVYQLGKRNFFNRILGRSIESNRPQIFEVERWYNRRENLQGVFSVSLYTGKSISPDEWAERYYQPLLKNVERVTHSVPNWQYRVYLDPSLEQSCANELVRKGAQVGIMKYGNFDHSGAVWRFLSASDAPAFLCLDADDDPFQTFQKDQIDKWIKSTNSFILVPLYLVNLLVPVSAGSWGGRANIIPDMANRLGKYNHGWFGADEAFLTKEIWPIIKEKGYYRTNQRKSVYLFLGGLVIFLVILILVALTYYIQEKRQKELRVKVL